MPSSEPHSDRGFSLVELVVTIVLLGVLGAIVVIALRGITATAEVAACESDGATIRRAEEVYRTQRGRYATEAELVEVGLLRSQSALNDITLEDDNFAITRVRPCSDDGEAVETALPAPAASGEQLDRTLLIAADFSGPILAGDVIGPSVTVRVRALDGTPLDGVPVTVRLLDGTSGSTLSGTLTVPSRDGVATFTDLTVDRSGDRFVLEASSPGGAPSVGPSFAIEPAAPSEIVVVAQPAAGIASVAWPTQPSFEVVDRFGNRVTSSDAEIAIGLESGSGPSGAAVSCDANTIVATGGAATFAGCATPTTGSGFRLLATSPGLATATTDPFTVTGAPAKLAFTRPPTSVTAGEPFAPTVAVSILDADGEVVAASTADVSLAFSSNRGGGTLAGRTTVAASDGVANFTDLSIDRAATRYTLSAAVTGVRTVTSGRFDVVAGRPTRLVFTQQPVSVRAGGKFTVQPKVAVQDSMGNAVTTDTGDITLTVTSGSGASGGRLTCSSNPRATRSGVASFGGCAIDVPGTGYTLTASRTGLLDGVSASFDNPIGPATKLAFDDQPTDSIAGSVIEPQVTVEILDASGNRVTNSAAEVTLTLISNGSGSELGGSVRVRAVGGVASFPTLRIDTAGTKYRVRATADDLTSSTSDRFDVLAASATRLRFITQPGDAAVNARWSPKPQVAVMDDFGNVVSWNSALVTLTITPGTGSGGAAIVCSQTTRPASAGIATFSSCRIDRAGSNYTLTANSSGIPPVVSRAFAIS